MCFFFFCTNLLKHQLAVNYSRTSFHHKILHLCQQPPSFVFFCFIFLFLTTHHHALKSAIIPFILPSPFHNSALPLVLSTFTLRLPAASTAPTVVPPVPQGEAVVLVLVAGVEAPSLTPPLHPPPPVATAAACHTSLRLQGASPHTASAVSPPMIRASCPRMQTSIPSLPRPCPLTSRARYKCLTPTNHRLYENRRQCAISSFHCTK